MPRADLERREHHEPQRERSAPDGRDDIEYDPQHRAPLCFAEEITMLVTSISIQIIFAVLVRNYNRLRYRKHGTFRANGMTVARSLHLPKTDQADSIAVVCNRGHIMQKQYLIAIALMCAACGPKSETLNNTEVGSNQIDPAPDTNPEDTVSLMKAGDTKACGAQDVKDTLTSMTFPNKPDFVTQSLWEQYTADITPKYSMITASGVDKDTSSVMCSVHVAVDNTFPGETDVDYRLSPDLNTGSGYIVRANISTMKAMLASATSRALQPLMQQMQDEEKSVHEQESTENTVTEAALADGTEIDNTVQ